MTDNSEIDEEMLNNLLATGGIYAALTTSPVFLCEKLKTVTKVFDANGGTTNQLDVIMDFLDSPYRITIERIRDR